MKTIILLLSFLSINTITHAQDSKFVSAMKKNLLLMDSAKTLSEWENASNGFERIANKETSQWLPDYYAAFCNIMMVYVVNDATKTDSYCDKAEKLIDRADSISPNNSEILCVKSMVASARIGVDPMTRGAKYGGIAGALLQKAKGMDTTNPRVYFLIGQGYFYTPVMFGGGKDKALPYFTEAGEKFKTFKPASGIAPKWGETRNKELMEQCKK